MLQRLAGPFREFGLFPGLIYAIHRLLSGLSPRLGLLYHDWMVQPIPEKPLLPPGLAKAYETREIPNGDPLIDRMPLRPEVPALRFAQNAICLGTFRKGELVGYIWLSFGLYNEDAARCTFVLQPKSESVFDFDLYVLEKYRMGMGFAAVWDGAADYLRRRGIRHSYSRLDHFNQASAAAHKHLRWRRVGRAIILRLWTVEVIVADIPPHLSILLTSDQRTRVTLVPDALRETG